MIGRNEEGTLPPALVIKLCRYRTIGRADRHFIEWSDAARMSQADAIGAVDGADGDWRGVRVAEGAAFEMRSAR